MHSAAAHQEVLGGLPAAPREGIVDADDRGDQQHGGEHHVVPHREGADTPRRVHGLTVGGVLPARKLASSRCAAGAGALPGRPGAHLLFPHAAGAAGVAPCGDWRRPPGVCPGEPRQPGERGRGDARPQQPLHPPRPTETFGSEVSGGSHATLSAHQVPGRVGPDLPAAADTWAGANWILFHVWRALTANDR